MTCPVNSGSSHFVRMFSTVSTDEVKFIVDIWQKGREVSGRVKWAAAGVHPLPESALMDCICAAEGLLFTKSVLMLQTW